MHLRDMWIDGTHSLRVKGDDGELVCFRVVTQFETAHVTAIPFSDFRLRVQWRMPKLRLTGGTAPCHIEELCMRDAIKVQMR